MSNAYRDALNEVRKGRMVVLLLLDDGRLTLSSNELDPEAKAEIEESDEATRELYYLTYALDRRNDSTGT